ncbi:hypothetical protein IT6_09515 [Methylacidiphilum caldifontis]|uniref:hypothetical protein n=1 Tax=Methylacidiphilum caldifontis TaxID=2795386 RepID=UPI001A8F9687|nr:hypothetical protein [Methylacidiphilum caldifontis]QSR88587.1 hypothetical protein IT6_09515 [Methylacidiphilum caldifontis]
MSFLIQFFQQPQKTAAKSVQTLDHIEKKRRLIAHLIIFIYFLLIFEGAIRKWVLPNQGRIIYFIRDPFVLLSYFLAFRYSLWPRPNFVFLLGIILGGMGILLGLFQILFSEQSTLFVFYGLRNYFFYLPLPFLMERVITKEMLTKLGKWTLYLFFPMLPLCFFQVISPRSSPINQGFGNDPETTFANLGVYGDIQRASGTFSFVVGIALFIACGLAFFMAFWIKMPHKKPIDKILIPLSGIAIFLTLLISGSRLAFFSCGIVIIFSLLAGFQSGQVRNTIIFIFYLFLVSVVAAFFATTIFTPIVEAMITRWTGAAGYEGDFLEIKRISDDLLRFIENMDFIPFWGLGIGSGSNAFGVLGNELPIYAEDDWSRHIVDFGPFIGLLYLLYRLFLLFYIGFKCWSATRKLRDPLPLTLFGFLSPVLFNGQISGQGTINGFNWLFAGFCLVASNKISLLQKTPFQMDQKI